MCCRFIKGYVRFIFALSLTGQIDIQTVKINQCSNLLLLRPAAGFCPMQKTILDAFFDPASLT